VIGLATNGIIDAAAARAPANAVASWKSFAIGAAFSPDGLMLADELYCTYIAFDTIIVAGADVRFEQNGARTTNFCRGLSLGRRDHFVRWTKCKIRTEWMNERQCSAFLDALTLREVLVGADLTLYSGSSQNPPSAIGMD